MFTDVTLTVYWVDEPRSLLIDQGQWSAVQSGVKQTIEGTGYYYEGEFFKTHWRFNYPEKGGLVVGYGDDGAEGFVGKITDAEVEVLEGLPEEEYNASDEMLAKIRDDTEMTFQGTWIQPEDIPDAQELEDFFGRETLEEHVTEARWKQIEAGGKFTKEEVAILQEEWAQSVLDDNPDCDKYASVGIFQALQENSGTVWGILKVSGYSFSEVQTEVIGTFKTEEDAYAYLRKYGRIDMKLESE